MHDQFKEEKEEFNELREKFKTVKADRNALRDSFKELIEEAKSNVNIASFRTP